MAQTREAGTRKVRKIRYHDQEWDRIVEHARACSLPPAVFVRRVSLGARLRARRNRAENELILHLGRIATQLQRLTGAAEESGELTAVAELRVALEETLDAVRRVG